MRTYGRTNTRILAKSGHIRSLTLYAYANVESAEKGDTYIAGECLYYRCARVQSAVLRGPCPLSLMAHTYVTRIMCITRAESWHNVSWKIENAY